MEECVEEGFVEGQLVEVEVARVQILALSCNWIMQACKMLVTGYTTGHFPLTHVRCPNAKK